MQNKFLNLLGFAKKSGNLIFGQTSVEKGIQTKKASLVILASDINSTTREKIVKLCNDQNIVYIESFDKDELSISIGKANIGIIGITNKKFSRALSDCLDKSD